MLVANIRANFENIKELEEARDKDFAEDFVDTVGWSCEYSEDKLYFEDNQCDNGIIYYRDLRSKVNEVLKRWGITEYILEYTSMLDYDDFATWYYLDKDSNGAKEYITASDSLQYTKYDKDWKEVKTVSENIRGLLEEYLSLKRSEFKELVAQKKINPLLKNQLK